MEELKKKLEERFPDVDFDEEKHLVTDEIIDSFAMVDIVSMLADDYGVFVTMEYMEPVNFDSVEAIWDMIQKLS